MTMSDVMRSADWLWPITSEALQSLPVDLLLDDMKVFCFAVGSLRTKRHGKIPVEVIHCNCGEAGIDHLIQRRIQPADAPCHVLQRRCHAY